MHDTKESTKQLWLSKYLTAVLVTIAGLGIAIAAIVLLMYMSHFPGPPSEQHTSWGVFGDFIGGSLNPVFGFLGLIALLLTLAVQSRELEISRQELVASRQQLERSAAAQEDSTRALNNQARAQHSQFTASIAQLRASASQARIEAIKIESLQHTESGRQQYAEKIRSEADALDKLAYDLADEAKNAG